MTTSRHLYVVTVMPQFPAWDERDGIRYTVNARSRADTIRRARRRAYDDGHTTGRRCYFRAALAAVGVQS